MHRAPDTVAAARRAAHHLREQRLDLEAAGDRMPVSAVRHGHVVVRPEYGDRSDAHGFLALAEMCRALDRALLEELLDLVLEQPDLDHSAIPGVSLIGQPAAPSTQPSVSRNPIVSPVSTSAIGSPRSTLSPTSFNQATIVPVSMS